jgi:hypothetical protein
MTVNAYIDKFEDLMTMLKQDTPELTEEWFVKCFVNGLRHDIKHQLRPLHPESLTDAYWQAKDMERSAPPKKQFSSYQSCSIQTFCAEPATTTPDKTKEQPAAPQVQQQRARKAGECWRCGEKWVPGHKCKLIPTINVMQETDTPNDATEEIAVQEEEEMKSHRIRTPLQMSISCIFRLMQFQGWSLLAHFQSRSLLVDKQALPLLIPAVQVHSLICLSQLKPLAISKRKIRLK